MRTTTDRHVLALAGAMLLLCTAPAAQAAPPTIAESGFNDAAGIHADPTPGSPYEFGQSIHGRSDLEPGWAERWVVSDGGSTSGQELGLAEADPTAPEGDGVLHVSIGRFGETWVYRRWAEAQSGAFILYQHVRLPEGGWMGSRPFEQCSLSGFGPAWGASNNRFRVMDGDGLGGGTWEDTGFSVVPMQWHEVKLVVDVSTQSWEFYVDGQRYDAPDPLDFRGSPASIRYVDYLAQDELWLDRIRITEIPEPATLSLLALGGLALLRRRKR
jgi:hypothetical protein